MAARQLGYETGRQEKWWKGEREGNAQNKREDVFTLRDAPSALFSSSIARAEDKMCKSVPQIRGDFHEMLLSVEK